MATVGPYTTKTGRRWRAHYRTPDRRQTDKRGFLTKRDAQVFAAQVEVQKSSGLLVSVSAGRATVGELAPGLKKKEHAAAPSHYRTLESTWRTHVQADRNARRVNDITTDEAEDWITRLSRCGCGVTTVRRAHAVLSGVLTEAIKSQRLVANPADAVGNLPRRHVYLTGSDVHRLASHAGEHRDVVLAFCGLRWGEAIALRVGDVDFLRHRIMLSSNAVQLGSAHHVGSTKGLRSRSVPVPGFVLEDLSRRCVGKTRDDLIFSTPPPAASCRTPALVTGGSPWRAGRGLPAMTVHDLRHTCASFAVSAGVNRAGLATHGGPRQREGHLGRVRRPLRHRSRRRRDQVGRHVFATDGGHVVGTRASGPGGAAQGRVEEDAR